MITQILILNKCDPTAVIGGKLPLINSNGIAGNSETMVCESCEFVDTFLQLSPDITVLLNIDNDHLDYFKTMDNLVNSFTKFISKGKLCYVNGDDELSVTACNNANVEKVTFGFNKSNDYYADNIEKGKYGFSFDVYKKGEKLINLALHIPGHHNILNALSAFAVTYDMGVEKDGIKDALEKFTGAGRRFEFWASITVFAWLTTMRTTRPRLLQPLLPLKIFLIITLLRYSNHLLFHVLHF
jgi:UDP-N-acetylmuramate--alanine ligase